VNILRGGSLLYAVVFEKQAAESVFLELPGHRFHEQPTVGNFASELGSNTNLKLVVFELRMSLAEYTERLLDIPWTSIPSARMLASMEREGFAIRLLSV